MSKELGASHQCAHRWEARSRAEGWDGLHDRSSRPPHLPEAYCRARRGHGARRAARSPGARLPRRGHRRPRTDRHSHPAPP
ncbi:leucine zipper domain-containing protein [Streptomyces sp. NPDC052109]|uniref:leucine zipper domain-containing protein n=1 Tax=Streptomyces sp. NPDC052109 TaxID=3155527 RepID=UPI00343AC226